MSGKKEKVIYENEILNLLNSKRSPVLISKYLEEYHPKDVASALEMMDQKEREMLYRLLELDFLSDIIEYLEEPQKYLDELGPEKAAEILENMESDEAVDILKAVDLNRRKAWMALMQEDIRKEFQLLASYSEEEIASRMTTDFIMIASGSSVKEAMNYVIEQAGDHDNISDIYVCDNRNKFYGVISLKDLIRTRSGTDLEDITVTTYPYVYADEKIDDCLEKIKGYSEESIPVLSEKNEILGIITSQDLVEVIDEEMGEDYAKLAGLTAEEDLEEPVFQSVKKRLPWLAALLGMGMVVSGVVGAFEAVVAQLTIIMCFQSLILDMSGNVGTQSLAVTIRVLMDENLTGSQKIQLILKEMKVGFTNGLIMGILSCIGVGCYIALSRHMAVTAAFSISACIGAALLLAMLVSSAVGTIIPMFFKKIGVDPAVASGPLITTINDLVAVVAYYGMAWLFLIKL